MTETAVGIPTRVLVLGMAHDDGTIRADELYPVAEACGQSTEQVRSCLRRLVAEGLFTRSGSGRDALFRATPEGRTTLGLRVERTRLAYAQDAAGRGWDRRWHLAGFAIPESKRGARDATRARVIELGGARVQGGLYVSPHPWEEDVRDAADRLGVLDHLTLAATDDLEVGGEPDPRRLAGRLWPLDRLAESYRRFTQTYAWAPDLLEEMRRERRRLTDTRFLPGALSMAVAFQEVFDQDPLLPPELLPRPWPGREARDIVVRSRRLALLARESSDQPAPFQLFDDIVERVTI